MLDWLRENQTLVWWLTGLSVGSLVLAALLLPVIVVRLPADHFVRPHRVGEGPRGWLDWLWHIAKNLLGVVLVIVGIVMIVLPGQGLLTILIGLMMVDFPGKTKLERRLIMRPRILKLINRMRERRGRLPLLTEQPAELPAPPAPAGPVET